MPLTDPIGDLLTRMRNAQHARQPECRAPWSKIKQAICDLLVTHDCLEAARAEGEATEKEIVVVFKADRPPLLLSRVSKPGSRKYAGAKDTRPVLHGAALAILSTSMGLLTDKEAKEKNAGGEVLCTVS